MSAANDISAGLSQLSKGVFGDRQPADFDGALDISGL
jgi:hypothetical protein